LTVLKEALWGPLEQTEYGPVLPLDDVIGTKVRALADRGAARDLIDIFAARELYTDVHLEALGRRHARDEFSVEDLADRLRGAEWYEDEAFTAYGLPEDRVRALRAWASAWAEDISRRLAQDELEEDGL
jgi:sirohydrochlorin ferrochelatase